MSDDGAAGGDPASSADPGGTPAERLTMSALLTRAGGGDPRAAEDLLPLLYDSLRALAHRRMARERPGQTLEPTALVHEAYLRLVGNEDPGWNGRRHFFGAAAQAMRRILVERARRVGRERHGGAMERVPLEAAEAEGAFEVAGLSNAELLDLDAALDDLRALDARAADIVLLRIFAGLTVDETVRALDVSERTVRREFAFARAWLGDRLGSEPALGGDDVTGEDVTREDGEKGEDA